MGAFYLVREPDPERRAVLVARLSGALERQGLGGERRLAAGGIELGLFEKRLFGGLQLHVEADGSFCAVTGTLVAAGRKGSPAAKHLLLESDPARPDWSRLTGNFCALVHRGNEVTLFTDPLGVYKVYTDAANTVFSSSFLAVAETLEVRRVKPQAVYEYVFQEATYGGDTVLEEVSLVEADGRYTLDAGVRFDRWPDAIATEVREEPREQSVEACVERLRRLFGDIAGAFGDSVDTALSGGYDSRLTLGLLAQAGLSPDIHVYGGDNDPDVRVAKRIAEGEGLALDHVDKSAHDVVGLDAFPAVVESNMRVFDGYPPSGVFDGGSDLASRCARGAGERLMLNGGGGEIFRNFFYLPDRALSVRELLWSFYSRFDPGVGRAPFDEAHYHRTLGDKILAVLDGANDGRLTRAQVEYVFPAFRCRFWMGRNNSINNRLGWSLTPFIDRELVRLTVAIPMRHKEHGRLEAAMIRAVSPALASYPSDYGHDFSSEPPARRIVKDYLTLLRPPWLRRHTYRFRYRKAHARGRYLQPAYLERVVDTGFPRLSRFFHMDRMNDPSAFARAATLEYLFDRLDAD